MRILDYISREGLGDTYQGIYNDAIIRESILMKDLETFKHILTIDYIVQSLDLITLELGLRDSYLMSPLIYRYMLSNRYILSRIRDAAFANGEREGQILRDIVQAREIIDREIRTLVSPASPVSPPPGSPVSPPPGSPESPPPASPASPPPASPRPPLLPHPLVDLQRLGGVRGGGLQNYYTVKELRQILRSLGFPPGSMKRSELISKIKSLV